MSLNVYKHQTECLSVKLTLALKTTVRTKVVSDFQQERANSSIGIKQTGNTEVCITNVEMQQSMHRAYLAGDVFLISLCTF